MPDNLVLPSPDWLSRLPDPFPPAWASAYGDDEYGVWAEFAVGKVVQRMRWIEPGQFWMGSPEHEHGRWEREGPRHLVTISHGFWLADTACSQALWQAVMGENPSHFNQQNGGGPSHPVENVSFNAILQFLEKLNARLPEEADFQVTLPTEAEWEYACRAGTTTPFWFGEDIDTGQANFDGNYPYRGEKKGEYRGKSMPVKSFEPNGWGLYQMHGNVREWCADVWTANYVGAVDVDPGLAHANDSGLGKAADRVLRGGSWLNGARYARTAVRDGNEPGRQYRNLGWRAALRSRHR